MKFISAALVVALFMGQTDASEVKLTSAIEVNDQIHRDHDIKKISKLTAKATKKALDKYQKEMEKKAEAKENAKKVKNEVKKVEKK